VTEIEIVNLGLNKDKLNKKMAGTVSRSQAEAYWKKYNKDGNDVLTVEEVKQCLQEVYGSADDFDVKVCRIIMSSNKTLIKTWAWLLNVMVTGLVGSSVTRVSIWHITW
jgi:hypothetical protein